jgi:hypothetical protein
MIHFCIAANLTLKTVILCKIGQALKCTVKPTLMAFVAFDQHTFFQPKYVTKRVANLLKYFFFVFSVQK